MRSLPSPAHRDATIAAETFDLLAGGSLRAGPEGPW